MNQLPVLQQVQLTTQRLPWTLPRWLERVLLRTVKLPKVKAMPHPPKAKAMLLPLKAKAMPHRRKAKATLLPLKATRLSNSQAV